MMYPLLFLLALVPRVEIVEANDVAVTYREVVPQRVALDPATHLFHRKGCPATGSQMQWASPAAATLAGYREHACNAPRTTEFVTRTEARVPHERAHIAVLFVGNSLTYFNEMPRMTQAIASREARPLLVDAVTQSGASLEDLWFRTDAVKRIWQEHWDYVILQERGGRAAMDRGELFHRYLALFADQTRKSGGKPVLFMTWYPGNEAFFRNAAKRANVSLLAVGSAWQDLLEHGRFSRLDWDGTHPNLAGSYLIACSVYALVYEKPPRGLRTDFRDLGTKTEFYDAPLVEQTLNDEQARAIQAAAWQANKP
jgi:hypothetical protein